MKIKHSKLYNKTQREYDNRPFTKYELDQAAKANTKAKTLRKRFKGSTYDGPPFARKTRKFDSVYKTSDGTKKVSPTKFIKYGKIITGSINKE